jgi:hypothetical protein
MSALDLDRERPAPTVEGPPDAHPLFELGFVVDARELAEVGARQMRAEHLCHRRGEAASLVQHTPVVEARQRAEHRSDRPRRQGGDHAPTERPQREGAKVACRHQRQPRVVVVAGHLGLVESMRSRER